jgi:hypothetical protein
LFESTGKPRLVRTLTIKQAAQVTLRNQPFRPPTTRKTRLFCVGTREERMGKRKKEKETPKRLYLFLPFFPRFFLLILVRPSKVLSFSPFYSVGSFQSGM